MSNRTLVELNHDHCPHDEAGALRLGLALMAYMRAADPTELPQGVEFRHYRHHSDPCPIDAAREAVKDIASRAHAHVAKFVR